MTLCDEIDLVNGGSFSFQPAQGLPFILFQKLQATFEDWAGHGRGGWPTIKGGMVRWNWRSVIRNRV